MTDLTQDWKKGELPNGWYWVKGSRTKGIYAYTAEYLNNTYRPINEERIIAPVPTFEEWQASEKYNKHLEEVIKIYERKDKQATETSIAYNELLEENTKLKELLKECKEVIKNVDTYYGNYDSTNGYLVINKINKALK